MCEMAINKKRHACEAEWGCKGESLEGDKERNK